MITSNFVGFSKSNHRKKVYTERKNSQHWMKMLGKKRSKINHKLLPYEKITNLIQSKHKKGNNKNQSRNKQN